MADIPYIELILLATLPAFIVGGVVVLLFNKHSKVENRSRIMEARLQTRREIIPLRLQAYERLAILLERMQPANLIARTSVHGLSARELHQKLIADIRAEFDHNTSQQIYVGASSWDYATNAREWLIKNLHIAFSQLEPDAQGIHLARAFVELSGAESPSPVTQAQVALRVEALELF